MVFRPIIRQSSLLLILGMGLQAPALGKARLEGPSWPDTRSGDLERMEDQRENRQGRPERREAKQERREDRQERREDRQEKREDRREQPREPRREPPMSTRPQPTPRAQPQPMPRPQSIPRSQPQPMPRPQPNVQPRASVQPRPIPHTAAPSRTREQARTWERSHGWRAEGAWAAHPTWQQHRARSWESEHRTWAHRGGYGGYIIPEPQFRVHFGPERWFRIRTRPMIHMGYPRFRYGNYWFLIVDPWPEFWSETWYADDEVYVDYNDGYYLHNRRHPGVSIAISVSL